MEELLSMKAPSSPLQRCSLARGYLTYDGLITVRQLGKVALRSYKAAS
jgi:hypothetical protein